MQRRGRWRKDRGEGEREREGEKKERERGHAGCQAPLPRKPLVVSSLAAREQGRAGERDAG
eukprot:1064435-Rhodomonas_salina.2